MKRSCDESKGWLHGEIPLGLRVGRLTLTAGDAALIDYTRLLKVFVYQDTLTSLSSFLILACFSPKKERMFPLF